MGKIIKRFKKQNVVVKMSRQRNKSGSDYKGWEYPVWMEIQDKSDPSYGWEQDPQIFQDKPEADKHYEEIVKTMKQNLKTAVYAYAPQIQQHL